MTIAGECSAISDYHSPPQVPPSIRGCLLSLSINSVFVNLGSPMASQGSEECLEFYTNLATFSGLGYLQLRTFIAHLSSFCLISGELVVDVHFPYTVYQPSRRVFK